MDDVAAPRHEALEPLERRSGLDTGDPGLHAAECELPFVPHDVPRWALVGSFKSLGDGSHVMAQPVASIRRQLQCCGRGFSITGVAGLHSRCAAADVGRSAPADSTPNCTFAYLSVDHRKVSNEKSAPRLFGVDNNSLLEGKPVDRKFVSLAEVCK